MLTRAQKGRMKTPSPFALVFTAFVLFVFAALPAKADTALVDSTSLVEDIEDLYRNASIRRRKHCGDSYNYLGTLERALEPDSQLIVMTGSTSVREMFRAFKNRLSGDSPSFRSSWFIRDALCARRRGGPGEGDLRGKTPRLI